MKLGCSSVLFNQVDLYGALQHISWAGYEGAELAIMGSHCRHIELITKQSYVDDIKWTAKKHNLGLFAIHADVGFGPGEDKIKSMQTLFDLAAKIGVPIVTMRAKGKSDDKAAPKRNLNTCGEWVKKRLAAASPWRLNRMSALPFTTPPRWCK